MRSMKTLQHWVPNGAGWLVALTQSFDPERLDPARRPVLIVPGYGMNSFIFSFHPRGTSLESYLVEQGFEVWRVDLRASGDSIRQGGGESFSLEDLALVDLTVAVDAALERTRSTAKRVDVIGASLGGSLVLMHAVLRPDHKLGTLVAMGSPVRWVKVHPVLRALFLSPMLVGLVRFRGARRAAEVALPLAAKHLPWLLRVYLNPAASDVGAAREMVKTVENPNRFINRQIARWMHQRDLVVGGVNVSLGLQRLTTPLLCIVANGDGIVPLETARFPYEQAGTADKGLLVVGTEEMTLAHADLFVSDQAVEVVFRPIADWFLRHEAA